MASSNGKYEGGIIMMAKRNDPGAIPDDVSKALLTFVNARRAQDAWYTLSRVEPDPRRETVQRRHDRIDAEYREEQRVCTACGAAETAFFQALDAWVASGE